MPVYRFTFGFEGKAQGWSETMAIRSAITTPGGLAQTARSIAFKRVTFLGREFAINAIRISRYSDDAGANRLRGVHPIQEYFQNPVQDVGQRAEPAEVALIARGTTAIALGAPAAFDANTSRSFLGAPPDASVTDGGDVDLGKSSLGANYGQWAQLVIQSGCGWLAQSTLYDGQLASAVQAETGRVILTTLTPLTPTLTAGQIYYARVRQINDGRSPLNGELIVRVTGQNTAITEAVIGIAREQVGGSIRIYKQINTFLPYATLEPQFVAGNHKRGRPFGSSPGRAQRRVRG